MRGANFTGAKAGLQRRWLIFQLIVSLLLTVIFNFVAALFNGVFIAYFFTPDFIKLNTIFPGIAAVAVLVAVFYAIAFQGLTTKAFGTIAVAVAVAEYLCCLAIVKRR